MILLFFFFLPKRHFVKIKMHPSHEYPDQGLFAKHGLILQYQLLHRLEEVHEPGNAGVVGCQHPLGPGDQDRPVHSGHNPFTGRLQVFVRELDEI